MNYINYIAKFLFVIRFDPIKLEIHPRKIFHKLYIVCVTYRVTILKYETNNLGHEDDRCKIVSRRCLCALRILYHESCLG